MNDGQAFSVWQSNFHVGSGHNPEHFVYCTKTNIITLSMRCCLWFCGYFYLTSSCVQFPSSLLRYYSTCFCLPVRWLLFILTKIMHDMILPGVQLHILRFVTTSDSWTFLSFAYRISTRHTGLLGTALSAQASVPMSLTPWEGSCTSRSTRRTFFSSEPPSSHWATRDEAWNLIYLLTHKCRFGANV